MLVTNRNARTKRASHAFTLIELLVVIAIIAILAAILFPVFAQARDKARQATALSNMKQIGIAMMMYTQDFDNLMPGYSWPESYQIGAKLNPYIKATPVFKDPSSPYEMGSMQHKQRDNGYGDYMLPPSDACIGLPKSQYEGTADNKYYVDIYPPMDFFTNQSLWHWEGGICTGAYGGAHVSESFDWDQITSPAKVVMMIDYPPSNAPWPGASFWGGTFKGYHSNGSVALHMDGHAKWYSYKTLYPKDSEDSGSKVEWTYWGLKFGDTSVQ